MRLSNKGFFLLDALLAVFILSWLCILCFSIFDMMKKYERGYQIHQERSNEHLQTILSELNDCEECYTDEHD